MRSLALALPLALALLSGPAAAQTTLRMANWLPPGHPLMKDVMVPYAAAIEQATEGRVTVEILDAPLGPPPAHYDFAVNGIADITYGVHGYNPGRFKTISIAEMPFLGDSAEVISVAYWRVYEKMLAAAGEADDVKVLAVFTHGPGEIFTEGTDLAADMPLQGTKIRVGGGIAGDVAAALGAAPVLAPSSKTYELLSGGVADGILFPFESVTFFKLDSLLDKGLVIPGGLYNTSFFVVMNKARWSALADEDKAAIDKVSGEALARMAGSAWDAADAAGRDAMKGHIALEEASAAQMAAFEAALQPVIDAKLAEVASTGVDAKAAMEALKAEIAAVAAE
ncbi:TRAP transporter substrate-binding protein [Acuticoccus sp. I52.16.1]|uniref:TRAP transporter substrate-binding protein n=1 Tax=Acuticoccus sp. I52.16.1 TaxID=2928472 RepID=UPI001FD5B89D|nr:TRAP transporter substrate-binding protein [Acuticoccus sp. I52.16.1]UOM33997.1 TRAP transporter substrate-binding protein [Acuticoccus sp. I52.16.1]